MQWIFAFFVSIKQNGNPKSGNIYQAKPESKGNNTVEPKILEGMK